MKFVAYIFCGLFCAFEIVLLVFYFKTFNGTISLNTDDWALFCQLANGLVIAFLTIINIAVFYKISISLGVKGKLFEAQSIITQMRVKQYENIRDLIKRIQVQVLQGSLVRNDVEELKKSFMVMDNSFLYKNDNIKDATFFKPLIEEILNKLEDTKRKEENYNLLSNFIMIFEFYIIQQLTRDKDLKKYIKNNKGYIDSTLICLDQFENDVINKMIANDKRKFKGNNNL